MSGSASDADPLARLADEFLERYRRGERPAVTDYTAAHPELAERIRELFSALMLMEDVRAGSHPAADVHEDEAPTVRPGAEGGAPALDPLTLPPAGRRYELLEQIGEGGMGSVLRARDPHLGRDLAVKVMRGGSHARPELLRRFVEEAQVSGQLQHPGTVPVHDIGCLEDGRPFIAMKLVKGRTLEALLQERASPAEDLPRFVGIFGQVCQTLAYAHSMGVLHRDLKPANVMVGAFGEVQVMDWGLAKVLRPSRGAPTPDVAARTASVRTIRSEAIEGRSRDGQALGTPAYMAPEQARGEVDRVDERADVFGLGAILCEILTGAPPFPAPSLHEVISQARAAELGDAFDRLERCGAEADLVRLTRECLSPRAADRPRNAGVVAAAVTAYQDSVAERLRRAELARTEAQVKAQEERKRRKLWVGLAAAAVVLVAVGGGGAWWLEQRRQAADVAVLRGMGEARLLLTQARNCRLIETDRYPDALTAARQAEEVARTGGASGEVRRQAEELVAELEKEVTAGAGDRRLVGALWDVRARREEPKAAVDDRGQTLWLAEPSVDEQFATAFREWGLDVDTTPTAMAAARLKGRPAAVVAEVIAALDQWTEERRRQRPQGEWARLAALAEALEDDSSPRRRELRALLARDKLAAERKLAAVSHALLPYAALAGLVPGEDRNRLRRLAAETDVATEPVLALLTLTRGLAEAGDADRAEELLRAAVEARPQEVALLNGVASLLLAQQPPRWRDAAEYYARARSLRRELGVVLAEALVKSGRKKEGLRLAERLAAERPDNPWVHVIRGLALAAHGEHKDAETAYRRAIQQMPALPEAHNQLGIALASQGRDKEAEEAFREAARLKPGDPRPHYNLGLSLQVQGRYKDSEPALRRALRLAPQHAGAQDSLGIALRSQGRLKEAEAAHREALRLDPGLPRAYHNLGVVLSDQRRYKQAEAAYRAAIRLRPDLSLPYTHLGIILALQGRYKEGEEAHRAAIRVRPDDFVAHYQLGKALAKLGRARDAETAFRTTIRLKPDHFEAHNELGIALRKQGRPREAEAAFREAIRLKPDEPDPHGNLGRILPQLGRFVEALECVKHAHELGSKRHGWPDPSGILVKRAARAAALAERLPAVLEGKDRPANADETVEFATLCEIMKRYAAAARLQAAALAADPAWAAQPRAPHRRLAATYAVLAATGEGVDAAPLDDGERARLRKQALDWLRTDLAAWAKDTDRPRVQKVLTMWQRERELAGVRDPQRLAKLPPAERAEWQRLWADVRALVPDQSLQEGRLQAAREQWRQAVVSYARALKLSPTDDGEVWFEYAAVQLLAGDREGYARARTYMLERCGRTPQLRAYHMARAWTLAPNAVADVERAGRLAQKELSTYDEAFWSLTQQGALRCRAGRFKQAVSLLRQSLGAEPSSGRAVLNWLWLALAEQGRGNAAEARRWSEKAGAWLDQYSAGMPVRAQQDLGLDLHNWLEAHILRREVEALLPASPNAPK
jgi:serine/threonine-protein kinase